MDTVHNSIVINHFEFVQKIMNQPYISSTQGPKN